MFVAVISQAEIAKCQNLLVNLLRKHLKKNKELIIGHRGESFSRSVYYDKNFWFSTYKNLHDRVPRYWNAFGVEIREKGGLVIAVEINPPLKGYTKRVSGLFARDENTGEYVLLHTGRIGGGGKGIGRKTFMDWSRNPRVEVVAPSGLKNEVIWVANLSSREVVNQILFFVREVANFKNEVKSGQLTRAPRTQKRMKEFSPEFFGRKRGYRLGSFEFESFHGLVVNSLEERIRLAHDNEDVNVFNTREIDIGVEIGDELVQLYEVKSSVYPQSIYTAIGQLIFHSADAVTVRKTIVVPFGQMNSDAKQALRLLQISVLEYRIIGKRVQFFQ